LKALINGCRLSYETFGKRSAVPIVLIHGFPFSQQMWEPQVHALSPHYFVITYDVRGHGESEIGDGQYTLELFVDDLLGLLDFLGVEKAVVCGLSMGGYIALRAIERNPERFRALVLCDTRSEADSNEGKIKRAAAARQIKAEGVEKFAADFVKAVFAPRSFEADLEMVNFIQDIIEETSPTTIVGTLIALAGRTDTTASLPNIRVPTLILVGEHDTLTPPTAAEAMHKSIPNSELHVIPNAAHLSNLENPEVFNKHFLNFLSHQK
jgi:3-oxoadipate enol-lactonase